MYLLVTKQISKSEPIVAGSAVAAGISVVTIVAILAVVAGIAALTVIVGRVAGT